MSAYIQILGHQSMGAGDGYRMADVFEQLQDKVFKVIRINKKEDVWPQFKKIFGGRL